MDKLPVDLDPDEPFLEMLVAANAALVRLVLQTGAASLTPISPRGAARGMRRLASGYVCSRSSYYHNPALLGPMRTMADALGQAQNDDGTYDQGNLHSPPDSGFTLQDLCIIWSVLHADGQSTTRPIAGTLERIIRRAGPALAVGGVHTPNHRWEICAALARINRLWPHHDYIERVDDWLAEGIDIDTDGQYSERSAIYASAVTNPCLLTIAWLLDRPELISHVRRNLEATLYLLDPNGEVETVHSRRQDQTHIRDIWPYLLQYRELALLDRNGQFARVARLIEQRGVGELGDFLAEVLERPELGAKLPADAALPEQYFRVFPASGLARIRRDSVTAAIFGGTDFRAIHTIASGLSTNPTFFKMRKGQATLDSVRLSPQFFSTGHFRSNGLHVGNTACHLRNEVSVPYHLPLPGEARREDGDYALTNDARFYSKMDFPRRPKHFRTLCIEIAIREVDNGFDLDFSIEESETPFTIELCFRKGGTLAGVVPVSDADGYLLVEGFGSYTAGDDRIEFGPGNGSDPRQSVIMDSGEYYTYLGGSLVPDGVRVYITGRSPIRYVLTLRTSAASG